MQNPALIATPAGRLALMLASAADQQVSAESQIDRGSCRDRAPPVLCPVNIGDGNG